MKISASMFGQLRLSVTSLVISFACSPTLQLTQFKNNLYQTLYAGRHQFGEECARFSTLWDKRSRSCSDKHENPV